MAVIIISMKPGKPTWPIEASGSVYTQIGWAWHIETSGPLQAAILFRLPNGTPGTFLRRFKGKQHMKIPIPPPERKKSKHHEQHRGHCKWNTATKPGTAGKMKRKTTTNETGVCDETSTFGKIERKTTPDEEGNPNFDKPCVMPVLRLVMALCAASSGRIKLGWPCFGEAPRLRVNQPGNFSKHKAKGDLNCSLPESMGFSRWG